MELRNLAFFFAVLVLAVSQCSEARHSMHRGRRETGADYDLFADEASEDELQNDDFDDHAPEASNQPPAVQAKIITTPKVYEVNKSSDVRLECNVDPENGTVAQWYKDGNLYFLNTMKISYDRDLSRYSIDPNSKDLIIKSVQPEDAGDYKCEVAQDKPVSVEHKLYLSKAPQIVSFTATNAGNVVEGTDLILTCEVIGVPQPQIFWSKNGEEGNHRLSEHDGEFNRNNRAGTLTIKAVKREHSGRYYCYAINNVGNDQHELDVIVVGKPHVHVHRTVVNSAIGVEAILECSSRYDANPHIRWYKDGVLIEDSSSNYVVSTHGPHSNLTVIPKEEADFGTFTCEAENNMGKRNRSVELVQRPVIESLSAEEGKLMWTVHSHSPLVEIVAELRSLENDGKWKQINVPIPSQASPRTEVILDLNDKQLEAGKYQAFVKVLNNLKWSDNVEPVVVEIDVQPSMSIQHASVFAGTSNAHSMQSASVVLSTILMYLLVRTM